MIALSENVAAIRNGKATVESNVNLVSEEHISVIVYALRIHDDDDDGDDDIVVRIPPSIRYGKSSVKVIYCTWCS